MFGVFADSLPDSYGELLLERYLKSKNIDMNKLTCLDRLAYVGSSGMGALEYVPDWSVEINENNYDFDVIQNECNDLLRAKEVQILMNFMLLVGPVAALGLNH